MAVAVIPLRRERGGGELTRRILFPTTVPYNFLECSHWCSIPKLIGGTGLRNANCMVKIVCSLGNLIGLIQTTARVLF